MNEGWQGWDQYAPFYDWENARTLARRDVAFWQRLAGVQEGPVLELGCGTGRILVPVAKTGASLVGIDRSAPMLARARTRLRRAGLAGRTRLVRGDIRALPFRT
ncbi:MAG TPA: methyltransferase domain-containing protein, partial [Vicinamibacterales bacterium]|nr:methyltransferase domain-containing protein [Vicinamibacterales bacterium]